MPQTAFIRHTDFALHDVGDGHPERPERIIHLINTIDQSPLAELLIHLPAQEAALSIALLNHPQKHIDWVESLRSLEMPTAVSADTIACAETPRVARLAVGAVIQAIDTVMQNRANNAFCAVRPPGHHAEYDGAMGFCFYNNIAIGARYLKHRYNLQRIAIIDWDVHHGNGTQHSFENDPSVFFASIHQYPHYPGTGSSREIGLGIGEGSTLNIPVPAGSGDTDYIDHFRKTIIPRVREFHPEFVLLSAGFDAHKKDPLGQINLSTEGFAALSDMVLELAVTCCAGRLVSVLEGGYDLDALAQSAIAHLQRLVQAQ